MPWSIAVVVTTAGPSIRASALPVWLRGLGRRRRERGRRVRRPCPSLLLRGPCVSAAEERESGERPENGGCCRGAGGGNGHEQRRARRRAGTGPLCVLTAQRCVGSVCRGRHGPGRAPRRAVLTSRSSGIRRPSERRYGLTTHSGTPTVCQPEVDREYGVEDCRARGRTCDPVGGSVPRDAPPLPGGVHPCSPSPATLRRRPIRRTWPRIVIARRGPSSGGRPRRCRSERHGGEHGAEADDDVHDHPEPGASGRPAPDRRTTGRCRAWRGSADRGRQADREAGDQDERERVAGEGVGQQRDPFARQRPALEQIGGHAVAAPSRRGTTPGPQSRRRR